MKFMKNINFIYNRLFCCNHTCYCVGIVSVTSASRYQSRSSMCIRGLIPRNPRNWPRQFRLFRGYTKTSRQWQFRCHQISVKRIHLFFTVMLKLTPIFQTVIILATLTNTSVATVNVSMQPTTVTRSTIVEIFQMSHKTAVSHIRCLPVYLRLHQYKGKLRCNFKAQWLRGRVLDSRQRAAGSSLTGVTALWSFSKTHFS